MNYPEALYERKLDDGRVIVVYSLLWGNARVGVGIDGAMVFDDEWHYESDLAACLAAAAWDGEQEPEGWHRHPSSGRRRPKGDVTQEYVRA